MHCFIAPDAAFIGDFRYQTTDPATNAPTGSPDTPADIASGAAQTFVLALQPTAATDADIAFTFGCQDTSSAAILPGINTLWLASSFVAAPDIVALAATAQNDGRVHLDPVTGAGAGATPTFSVFASASAAVTSHRPGDDRPLV